MYKLILLITMIFLASCASIPRQKLQWTSGDYEISVSRSGCEIGNIRIRNNGAKVSQVFGTLDILDTNSTTVSTVRFGCDNAYPGGTALCRQSQTYNEQALMEMPGFYCAGYSTYRLSLNKY